MDPPFISPPLVPSLSTISAGSVYHNKSAASTKSSNRTAKGALNTISQSQKPQTDTISDEKTSQPISCRSPSTTNTTSLKSANSKASQWSTLVSVGQNDITAKNVSSSVNQSHPRTISSYTTTSQASPLSAQSIESLPHHARRKLSLSEPKDALNSAPNMHRRPMTGYNRAGVFCGPACSKFSGFENPAVAAAEERWRRGNESVPERSRRQQDEHDYIQPFRRKARLSTPEDTEKNSSPKLHFRGHSTSGTFTEWICREQSGFANPTYAASTQRWQNPANSNADESRAMTGTVESGFNNMNHNPMRRWGEANEQESQGPSNGLPTANSWDMTKSHVMCSSNCFDPISNGFGTGGRVKASSAAEAVDEEHPAFISFGPVSNRRTERADEFDQWSSRGGKSAPSMVAANQAVEAHLASRIVDGTTPYPVPRGLIAASIRAQKAGSSSPDEKNHGATLQRLGYELAYNNDGATTHNDGLYAPHMVIQHPRSEKRDKGSQLPVRTSRGNSNGLRPSYPSGFGERSGVYMEICSTRGVDFDKESTDENGQFDTNEFDDQAHESTIRTESNEEVVAAQRERHIKGTHLPLRITKGNALGLRSSQARNTGFGEGSGYPSVDKYGDRHV